MAQLLLHPTLLLLQLQLMNSVVNCKTYDGRVSANITAQSVMLTESNAYYTWRMQTVSLGMLVCALYLLQLSTV